MEEGYNTFDEKYVRWLLLRYPDKVPSDWLQKVPTSSKQQIATGKGYQHVILEHYSYLRMQQLLYLWMDYTPLMLPRAAKLGRV